jgi:thiamine biosynthesis lipoprotein
VTSIDTSREARPAPEPVISRRGFRAMATDVSFQVVEPGHGADQALAAAAEVFARVEAACTRFDPGSPLMQANAAGDEWFAVPRECFAAISEAALAHQETKGAFDPRVLDSLVALGYDRSLPFASERVELPARATTDDPAALPRLPDLTPPRDLGRWVPGLAPGTLSVRVGPRRLDLGGIGKGLAVRWASAVLAAAGTSHLIDAGGDCYLAGPGPLGSGWRVGVEDPNAGDGAEPLAVLELQDLGCATSSLRVRAWTLGTERVHHLIDPRTGRSCDPGLRAVTVVGPDTARAEVWSKALLIEGRDAISSLAHAHDLAALWIDADGRIGLSPAMHPHVIWESWT